jgi:hypothetical protein
MSKQIEAMKLALDDLISEYYMESSSFAKRVDEIFREALAEQQEPLTGGDERRHIICLCPDCTKPAREWMGLDDTDLDVCDTDGVLLARYWERVLREKNQ